MDTSNKYICKLSREEKDYARVNLNETDDNRAKTIEEIRQWLINNPEIFAPTDDFTILTFLRTRKFDVEETKVRMRNYYEQKTNCPEWYTNRDPFTPEFQEILDLGLFLPLRKVDNENRLVILFRTCLHNPKRHSIDSLIKVSMSILELTLRNNDLLTIYGTAFVLDVKGATLSYALQMTISHVKKIAHCWQGCSPAMVKSMDFVNLPFHMEVLLNVAKNLLSSKLKSRVFAHSNDSVIGEKFPKEILPVEYGGTNGTIDDLRVYWKQQVEENKDWLIEDEKYKVLK